MSAIDRAVVHAEKAHPQKDSSSAAAERNAPSASKAAAWIDRFAWLRALGRRAKPYVPALLASGLVGSWTVWAILSRVGHPAVPLDDAFIHFQYARRLAEGHFFSYVEGEGYTSGATSLLWPMLLAPFYLLGLRDLSIIYAAWALGWLFHAALTVETARIARRLVGPWGALGAGAMCQLFGAFAWFASSGMETVPLAWILMRAARVGAALCEPDAHRIANGDASRPASRRIELVLIALAAPLIRPEGALASLIAAIALFAALSAPQRSAGARRQWARYLAPVGCFVAPALPSLVHFTLSGNASSSTARVKWLLLNPTYTPEQLSRAIVSNVHLLVTNVLDGGDWTAVFLPVGAAIPIVLGLGALVRVGAQRAGDAGDGDGDAGELNAG